jgi:two-component system OmpR family sensor kinase
VKLRTRLTFASAAVTSISTLLIGGFAVNSSHNSGIALLDNSLNAVAVSVRGASTAALSNALYSVQQSNMALTLVYYTARKVPSVLNLSSLTVIPNPTNNEIAASRKHPITHTGLENYRFRTMQLSDGEYLVVAASLNDIDNRYQSDLLHLILFILICLVAAGIATAALVRRDMKRIEELIGTAGEIAGGDTNVHIALDQGNSEIDQLGESLNKMVAALRHTAEIEEQAAIRMQDFLGDASHELRTPLTVVKGYVELLAGPAMADPQNRARAFERVSSEIVRMERLISDLLFLAEFGDVPLQDFESIDISEILKSHLADFSILDESRSIESRIESDVKIEGSASHMARLFSNIFGNISRHTPPSAPVRVTLIRMQDGAHLTIEDGGLGLPDGAYARGLQSFQRFDKSRSREDGGSGLGMSIIFAIAREHSASATLQRSDLGGLGVNIVFSNVVFSNLIS